MDPTVQDLDQMIEALQRIRKRVAAGANPDLVAARAIAAEQSRQTGKNLENFLSGRYDRAYGVRTARAAIKWARANPQQPLPAARRVVF